MTFRIAHITDTHLSREKPFFIENFLVIAERLRLIPPDLVVNTGDVSLNGADSQPDLEAARELHDALGIPWLAIPGNHDVGDNQEIARKQPANAERRARWLDVFGRDWWMRDVPGWRLLGINSLLLGSDITAAAEQERFITEAASTLGDRSLALFLHKPLFHDTLDDREVSGHAVNPGPRRRLLDALGAVTPRLVCCGHLHEHRERAAGDIHQIWAPATSFTLSEWFLPTHGGEHIVGFIDLELDEDGSFRTALVQPDELEAHDLADFPEAYGDLRKIKADIEAQRRDAA
jgi:3',5'-cyclic AMP phosphodiesterase CpdA